MTKIKKIKFFVDYTKNPINFAVTPSINLINKVVFTYDAVFDAYSDSKLLKPNGKMTTRSVLYKDPISQTLTGQGNCACSFRSTSGDVVDVYKNADIVHNYIDSIHPGPLDNIITSTRFENIAIDKVFINGNRVHCVWNDIKYNQSKKRYTVLYQERDKN
jgi:hypothetical protein